LDVFFLYVGKVRCRTPGPTTPRRDGGWPRCIVAATPATPPCSALHTLHALHCNDATMQRRGARDEPGLPAALVFPSHPAPCHPDGFAVLEKGPPLSPAGERGRG